MANKTLGYFRLYSSKPQTKANAAGVPTVGGNAAGNRSSTLWSLAHFICLVLGIVAYPFIKAFQDGTPDSFKITIPLIIFSIIAAVAIFPAVFKKSFNTDDLIETK